jgi:hypothetical protein
MKRWILWAAVIVLATILWLRFQRVSSPTGQERVSVTKQATAINSMTNGDLPPHGAAKPSFGKPPAIIAADDEEDDKLWKTTPEYKTFEDEFTALFTTGEARQVARGEHQDGYLTSNEVAFVITNMQSPHYNARRKAVIFAGGIWGSDPARSTLLPYVVSLLSDPVWLVRMWAADTLGVIGDGDSIRYLEPLLNDTPKVAVFAQRAISKLQQKENPPKN